MTRFRFIWALLGFILAVNPGVAAELVMVEQAGCEWCEAWNEEVGVIYHKTPEGRTAPLRRVDIHEPLPRDLEFIRGLVYTPTFVLVDNGKEIGRILGFPGEGFFWGLLQQLLEKLPETDESETARKPFLERDSDAIGIPGNKG